MKESIGRKEHKIENQDSIIAEIVNNTKIELDYIIHCSEILNNSDFNSIKIAESLELAEILNHSQKAFTTADHFLLLKKNEINKNKADISEKEVQVLDLIHNLKNNFGSFVGFCDLINDGDLSEEEFKEYSAIILNEAKKVEIRLRDFTIEQLENNSTKISEIDLGLHIKDFIEVLKKEAEYKDITIDNQMVDGMKVKTDSVKLESVLNNLIYNAIKFTNHGGSIKIKSEIEDNSVKIYVEDNGVGITKEHQDKFFESIGQTTLGTDGEKGTGIGVYTINKLLQEIGGTISVESEGEGKGATFIVTLPAL